MYTYNLYCTGGSTSATANAWLSGPHLSVKAGNHDVTLMGLKIPIYVYATVAYYIIVVRRVGAYTTGGAAVPPLFLTTDATSNPQFSAIWSASGALTVTRSLADFEALRMAGGSVGQTEWVDGGNLILPANDPGSLDIYVAASQVSQGFNFNAFVVEN